MQTKSQVNRIAHQKETKNTFSITEEKNDTLQFFDTIKFSCGNI